MTRARVIVKEMTFINKVVLARRHDEAISFRTNTEIASLCSQGHILIV